MRVFRGTGAVVLLAFGAQVSRASDLQDGLTQQWVEMREKDPPESLLSSLFVDVPFPLEGACEAYLSTVYC